MSILSDLVKMYELWGTWKDKQISEPEEELVITALEANGQLFVFETSLDGEFVSIGTRYYLDERDPAVRARYLEALEKLFRRGLVRHEGGQLFCLSGSGFDAARHSADRRRPALDPWLHRRVPAP